MQFLSTIVSSEYSPACVGAGVSGGGGRSIKHSVNGSVIFGVAEEVFQMISP